MRSSRVLRGRLIGVGTFGMLAGSFSQGAFRVTQSASGGGSTEVMLLGACTSARAARDGRRATIASPPHHHVRRFLQISADGKFVIVGANATAIETGPAAWDVNDNCDGTTTIADHRGTVQQSSRAGHVSQLPPGASGVYFCHPRSGPLRYCQDVISEPDSNLGGFELDIFHQREQKFAVCLVSKGKTRLCEVGRFRTDRSGSEATVLNCYLNTLARGTYQVRFLVRGAQIGILLPFTTNHVPVLIGSTNSSCAAFIY